MNADEEHYLPPWADPALVPDEIILQSDPGDERYVEAEEERWHIRSDAEAEWAMAHVAAAQGELDALQDQYALWRQQLDRWFEAAQRRPARTREFFGEHLSQYTMAVRVASGDKVKSIKLASGEVATSKASRKVIVVDDDKVVAWAEELGIDDTVVKTTKKPLLTPLREVVVIEDVHDEDGNVVGHKVLHHETGEVVPGVGVEPETLSAKVKPVPAIQKPRGVRYALGPTGA